MRSRGFFATCARTNERSRARTLGDSHSRQSPGASRRRSHSGQLQSSSQSSVANSESIARRQPDVIAHAENRTPPQHGSTRERSEAGKIAISDRGATGRRGVFEGDRSPLVNITLIIGLFGNGAGIGPVDVLRTAAKGVGPIRPNA